MIGIFTFGDQTELRYLGEVPIKGKDGEDLCLLFKMTMTSFFVPLFLSRDGYVLGIIEKRDPKKGKLWWSRKTFYPMTNEQIAAWQETGYLPNPLPEYKTKIRDTWPLWIGWFFVGLFALSGIISLVSH